MDWREFLEKDSLDGKGANDKIKPTEWHDDPPVDDAYGKDVKIKPKKYLNVARDAKLYNSDSKGNETESSKKITRKQTNSGKLTGLDDAHSNEVFSGKPNPRGDGGHRGDELGAIEHYKRKLRHGQSIGKPNFTLSSGTYDEGNKIGGHEGRHRARAAMEEGHKTIPTKLVAYSGADADEYGVGEKNRGRKGMKNIKYEEHVSEKPEMGTENPFKRRSPPKGMALGNQKHSDWQKTRLPKVKPKTDKSEDTRHPIFGRKKSWEVWLEKNADINDHYDDISERTTRNQEAWDIGSHEWKYDKDKKEITRDGKPHCTNCAPNAQEMRKKFPKSKLRKIQGTVRHDGQDKDHAWNINPKGHIIDGSRDQFGDEKKIHIIKPNDKKHKEYTTNEAHLGKTPDHLYGRARKKLNRQYDRAHNEGSYKRSEDEKKITAGMESLKSWEVWLEKVDIQTSIVDWTEKPKKKVKFREDDDKGGAWEDSGYAKNASWESWLEKEDKPEEEPERDYLAEMKIQGEKNIAAGINDPKRLSFLKDQKKTPKRIKRITGANKLISNNAKKLRTNTKNPKHYMGEEQNLDDLDGWLENDKSWESWLDKNNATETSHKDGEKKVEWDGKFSSSTIEDEVKNEDEKSNSEEESLEELTDGDLVEIEKLKSWELWLEKDALNQDSKYKPSLMNTQRFARISTEVRGGGTQGGKLGDASQRGLKREEKHPKKRQKQPGKWRKNHVGVESSTETPPNKKLYHESERESGHYPALGTDSGSESSKKFLKLFQNRKSWEVWLEKNDRWDSKFERNLDNTHNAVGTHINEEKQRTDKIEDDEIWGEVDNDVLSNNRKLGNRKPPMTLDTPNFTAKKPKYHKGVEQQDKDVSERRNSLNIEIADSMKSWEGWLEKMQGAGDARFGNQHLTGLDQKPVNNEEDEANILPEKDEKTDDKEEKEEITDNKPYKALGEE